jgi:hypothetical protein
MLMAPKWVSEEVPFPFIPRFLDILGPNVNSRYKFIYNSECLMSFMFKIAKKDTRGVALMRS